MSEIQKNGEHTVDITGMTHEGMGVGRIGVGGYTVFVGGTLAGERVDIKLIKVNKTYGIGKLMRIRKESHDRTNPFCSVFGRCGGCTLQHMTYKAQLAYKTGLVRESIRRLGGLENVLVHDTIGMKDNMHYRNKAQYPVGRASSNRTPNAGFYAARSHDIVDASGCSIQTGESDAVRRVVLDFMSVYHIDAYDEKSRKGLVRHIMVRSGFRTGEVMAVIVINGTDLPHSEQLIEMLPDAVPSIKSIYLNINTKNTNIILGPRNVRIYGNDTIAEVICGYRFEISPSSFFQVNPLQTEVLYGKVLEYAALTGKETVFDLYCGAGTIAITMSDAAERVVGVEVVDESVADARRNAALNDVHNVEFVAGMAEKAVPELYAAGVRADVVVVDPPRKGCDESLLRTIADMAPERVVYVSCNPATLARDLKYLAGKGFTVMEVQPVDMFPYTGHVETVTKLERTSNP